MSSLTRSMERKLIRKQAEEENVPERSKLRRERTDPTASLSMDKNVDTFRKKWDEYHYPSVEVKDKDGNITTVKKRKPIKKKRYFLSGKQLVNRMAYEKSLREKIAEKFREFKKKRKEEAEAKKKAKEAKKQKNEEQKTVKE